jgi:hypothetical protein
MKYSYIFNKVNLLFKFASLEDEIAKLSTSKDIIDFLLKIQDSKLKGQAFNFVKTKNPNSIQEVELFLNSILEKNKKIKELKENTLKSKESNIPDELKSIYNSITYPKLKQLILYKIEQKEITSNNNLQEKLDKISHYLQEVKKDSSLDELKRYSLDDIYKAAVEWEKLFKSNVKEIALDSSKIVYGPTWKNPEFNGYFIYQLTTEEELKKEGSDLNHCVGGYFDKVKNNNCKIFSLRNSSNKAVLTIETSPDLFRFIQVFGYSNAQPNSEQTSIINEWKQSLHSKDKIIQLSKGNKQQKISSAEFMDYKDPDYKVIIDKFIKHEEDSSKEFLETYENNALDVLQALAANETLDPICYDKIYKKCEYNNSTVHNLIKNKNISNALFLKILNNNKNNSDIMRAITSSFKLKEDVIYNEFIKVIDFSDIYLIKILLNNPSVSSAKAKEFINKLSADQIEEILDEVENLEPKFIKDLLSLDKIDKRHYIRILIENNLSQEIMAEIARKFDIKLLTYNKEDLLELLLEKEIPVEYLYRSSTNAELTNECFNYLLNKNNNGINNNLSSNKNLTSEQINILLNKNNDNINKKLSRNPKLTSEQINILLNKNNAFINENLAENPNLTAEQINILLNKNNNGINNNLSSNKNLTNEQINILLNINNGYIDCNLAENSNLTSEQFNILLNKNYYDINESLARNPNLTNEQFKILLSYDNDKINYNLTSNLNLTNEQFYLLLNKNNVNLDIRLALNLNLTNEQINILLNKNNDIINGYLSGNPKLTLEQINILLNKNDYDIDGKLASNPNLTSEQIKFLFNKNDEGINYNLAANPNLTREQTIKLLQYGPVTLIKYFGNNTKNAILLKNIYQLNKVAKINIFNKIGKL